ncbi:MAG TPA: PhnD/SsuA/transferrin family substrate-binding protein [Acidimicrobiales bacterium]|nr:PhnD/SsuA/transferrin family substrate-binding protein [Acidimicrobiales bacterium]
MPPVSMAGALSVSPMTEPILSGRVTPEGLSVAWTGLHPSEMFWRQLRFAEFEVSELSLSSLLIAVDRGDTRWLALPVFTTREFFHTRILVRADAGIERPEDLAGKRVGVPEYQQTAALWSRGVLQHEFGVAPADMRWFMERPPELSHGGATGFRPPDGVELSYIPPETDIGHMLVAGELDATLLYLADRNLVDRSRLDLDSDPRVRPLFADRGAEGVRYFEKTGVLPVNHCVAVRRDVAEAHPWAVLNLFDMFVAAKEELYGRLRQGLKPFQNLGWLPGDGSVTARDPLPYGIAGQRHVLETLAAYSYEQGLTTKPVALEEVFAPSTLDL